MIPQMISIQNDQLPDHPGVYLMKDASGTILYIGKATSLLRRVNQHFQRPHNGLIEEMTRLVRRIEYVETASVLEALILEANLIKLHWPPYNTAQKDSKTFLFLVITNEVYPKPLLLRGGELAMEGKGYKAVFGPYTSGRSLRAALDEIRKIFPWSTCEPGQKKACFSSHLGLCPGVCTGMISPIAYRRIIRDLIAFFEGKKTEILKRYRREMLLAAKKQAFEEATQWRNKVFALEHIRDIALLKREDLEETDIREENKLFFGRIEGYDISHISGTAMVASLVVFQNGAPAKTAYRKFHIRNVAGVNDLAALQEVLRRRFKHTEWPKPDLLLIDGGLPQVMAVEAVLQELGWNVPFLGMAKGPDRKKTELISVERYRSLREEAEKQLTLLTQVRDESHRFAITFHRETRSRRFLAPGV